MALLVMAVLFTGSLTLVAQDDLKEEILKEVRKIIEEENAKLLRKIEKLIRPEKQAKATEVEKPKPEPEKPKAEGYLGVNVSEVAEEEREELGLAAGEGAIRIDRIMPDSAASKSGLQEQDVILKLDGEPVQDIPGLAQTIREKGATTKVKFDVIRDGERMQVAATLGTRPEAGPQRERPQGRRQPGRGPGRGGDMEDLRKRMKDMGMSEEQIEEYIKQIQERFRDMGGEERQPPPQKEPEEKKIPTDEGRPYLGILVDELTDEAARTAGVEPGKGIYISGVREGTPAEEAGFETDDVIVELDGKPVEGEQSLRDLMRSAKPGQKVRCVVARNGEKVTLEVTLGRK